MEQKPISSGSGYGKGRVWRWIIIYLIFAIVVYGFLYFFVFSKKSGYTYKPSQTYPSAKQYTPPANLPATGQLANPAEPPANSQNIVTYTDSGFSPSALNVRIGNTVIFKNTASDNMWVASNPHPTHNGYPTKGGCISSTFDSCGNISPGQSWSFKFDVPGKWNYHNHSNPRENGTIVVQ